MKQRLICGFPSYDYDPISRDLINSFIEKCDEVVDKVHFMKQLEKLKSYEDKTYIDTQHAYRHSDRYSLRQKMFLTGMWRNLFDSNYEDAYFELCEYLSGVNVLEVRIFLIIEYIYSYLEGNTDMTWSELCKHRSRHQTIKPKETHSKYTVDLYKIDDDTIRLRYNDAMLETARAMKVAYTDEERQTLLDYYIFVITSDLISSCRRFYFCRERSQSIWDGYEYFPLSFRIEELDHSIVTSNYKEIDLSKVPIITSAWNNKRTAESLIKLKNIPFAKDPVNHYAKYYSGLGFAVSTQGHHSINAGAFYEKGVIDARIYDVKAAYPYIDTDGVNWVYKGSGDILDSVLDYRVAILYELQRMKSDLIHKSAPS